MRRDGITTLNNILSNSSYMANQSESQYERPNLWDMIQRSDSSSNKESIFANEHYFKMSGNSELTLQARVEYLEKQDQYLLILTDVSCFREL